MRSAITIGRAARARRIDLIAAEALRRAKRPARARSFTGAATGRLTSDWITSPISPEQEILQNLSRLRQRSRDLVRNNEYAARFVKLVDENVIGMYGIEAQPANRLADGTLDRALNRKIRDAFEAWGSSPDCASADGRLSWLDLQGLVARSLPADGEVFLRLVRAARNPFGFALTPIAPELCDHEYSIAAGRGQAEIRQGVEIDESGRPVAYWFWTSHPSDYARKRERIRIPASEIVHVYLVDRPGRIRGVPWFAPVLFKSKMLDGYEEAELVAARTAAAKMGFFKKTADAPPENPNTQGQQDDLYIEVEAGSMEILPTGYEFQGWDPQHPSTAFETFTGTILRGLASGMNVSYASLTGDLRNANYSSARVGSLQERDGWQKLQIWLATHLHARVYREWLKWAVTARALDIGTFDATRPVRCLWQPRGWPWVDPRADIEAAEKEIALGVNSRTTICAERGRDFSEILDELAEEERLAAEKGVSITALNAKVAAASGPNSGDIDEDEDAGADRSRARIRAVG